MALSQSARRVQEALVARGVAVDVVELPASARTAQEAAAAIGCEVRHIAKSLVFKRAGTGEPVLAIVSGANRVDEAKLATVVGEPIVKADATYVRERLGFAIGGVPPVGHSATVSTLVDASLLEHGVIWAAAGTPHAVVRLTAEQLIAVTGGRVVSIAC